ncbi:Peptidylprolyl isomerase [Gracilaria domingensis]|nr:Peptidylprolyl isomerase [Gracilaria domingensis]
MEAFVASSPLRTSGRSLSHRKCSQKRRGIIFAKAKQPKRPAPKSDGFSGMAAGPSAPSKQRKSLSSNKPSKALEDAKQQPESSSSDSTDSKASGKKVTRALGTRREPKASKLITKKTREDFIAEGIVDDVDDGIPTQFAPADIRFGIDDVQDPFRIEQAELAKKGAEMEAEKARESVGQSMDVTGDGGVAKVIVRQGEGKVADTGATVKVQYQGKFEDGSVFDDSSSRGAFEFVLGNGTVIKGWEAGVATMRKGEVAQFTIQPNYAYGRKGMPPVIPSNAVLTFEIELISITGGEKESIKKVADFNPGIARTPADIAREYEAKLEKQAERKKNMSFLDRFYIISPFASQSGEKPPWWINPNITFFLISGMVAVGFYLVLLSGAIHVGYVDHPVDVNIFK